MSDKPSLTDADMVKLKRMTQELVAGSDSMEAQRPTFEAASADMDRKIKKGLLPGGARGAHDAAKTFSINLFPRDMDAKDFSMSRYCMAVDRSLHTIEGSSAFSKWAPRETSYYEALAKYGKEFKAAGELVSGQDGGFLAPVKFRVAA